MVAEKGHPKPLEKAAAAIEMPQRQLQKPQRQLQSRSGNADAAAAIANPKRLFKCRCDNRKAAAAIYNSSRHSNIITACEPTEDF